MSSIVHETIKSSDQSKENSLVRGKEIFSWIRFILLVIAVFLLFRFGISVTVVSGDSMNPTFNEGNVVLTNNLLYKLERNDIVVFHDDGGYDVIKRIIALPNETVEITAGVVYVNGQPIDEPYISGLPNDMPQVIVGDNSYFVMGDNRTPGESLDSRSNELGTIPKDEIKGEMVISIVPFSW